jgi:atypical dual specificity phosphatase
MDCTWIEPNILAAGSIPVEENDIRALHRENIRAILTLTERPITAFHEITTALLDKLDIYYLHVPIPDQHPPTLEQTQQILRFINNMKLQSRPVFVHCQAGVGRTGTILHLYFIMQGMTFEEADAIVRSKRIQCILLSEAQVAFLKNVERQSPKNGKG